MLQSGRENHAALRSLANKHRPFVLNADKVDNLLLKRLVVPSVAKPLIAEAIVISHAQRESSATGVEESTLEAEAAKV